MLGCKRVIHPMILRQWKWLWIWRFDDDGSDGSDVGFTIYLVSARLGLCAVHAVAVGAPMNVVEAGSSTGLWSTQIS